MDKNDYIQNDEELYRNVRGGLENKEYVYDDDGILRILPEAFGDTSRSKNPSVDRAKTLNCKPERALLPKKPRHKRNGIVSIKAIDVRTITNVKTETEDRTVRHAVDVVFDPSKFRPAHSLITVDPEFLGSKKGKRRRLQICSMLSLGGPLNTVGHCAPKNNAAPKLTFTCLLALL